MSPLGAKAALPAPILKLWNRLKSVRVALYDQALISGVNFGSNLLIARFLGISDFGLFGVVYSIIVMFNTLQMSAIVSPMMTIGAKMPKPLEPRYYAAVISHAVGYGLLTSVLVGIITILIGAFSARWPLQHFAVAAVLANFAFQMQDFSRRYYFARGRPQMAFLIDGLSYGSQILVLGLVLGLKLGRGPNAALEVIAATSALSLVAACLRPGKLKSPGKMLRYVLKRHWRFARWLIGTSGLRILPGYVYVGAAVFFLSPAALGGLRAAQKLMGLTHILHQGLLNIVPREAARRLDQSGIRPMKSYLWKVFAMTGGGTIIVSVIAAIGAPFWLHLVYGKGYSQYALLLRLFALQYIFVSTTLPLVAGLNAMERTRGVFIGSAIQAGLMFVLVVPMMSWLNVTGVVLMNIIISVAYFIALFIALWWVLRSAKKASIYPTAA